MKVVTREDVNTASTTLRLVIFCKSQIPLRYPASELVADLVASWNLAYHALSSSLTGLRPGLRLNSVMEFG